MTRAERKKRRQLLTNMQDALVAINNVLDCHRGTIMTMDVVATVATLKNSEYALRFAIQTVEESLRYKK